MEKVDITNNKVQPVPAGTKRPLWSVMIPTFNPGKYFIDSVNSVISQNISPEIMQIDVVDDCSNKVDIPKIIEENWKGRVGYHRLERNVGHSFNFTESVRRAKGELVYLLHDDDLVKPGFYAAFENIFKKHEDIGAAFCRQEYIDDDNNFMFYSEPEMEETGILDNALIKLAEKQRIQYCAMVVKRKVFEAIGGFVTKNIGCEDWEMWVRIAAHFKIGYEPEALAQYRIHRTSMTLTDMRSGQDMRFLREAADIFTQYLPAEKREEVSLFRNRHYAVYSFNNARRMLEEFNDEEGAAAQLSETIILNSELVFENVDFLSKFSIPIESTGVSVVVNTQNDEETIERTLRHLIIQRVPKYIPWEIILVDNESTDNTVKIAKETWSKYNGKTPFRIIENPSLNFVEQRNIGIENAKYNYVLFCNPGDFLKRNYVEMVSVNMMRDINLGVLGAYTEPFIKTETPAWFENWSNYCYQTGEQYDHTSAVTWTNGFVWGSGMAIRKDAWKTVTGRNFRSVFENSKEKITRHGIDNELCYAMRLSGWTIWYSIDLRLTHYFSEQDLSWKKLRNIWKQYGVNNIVLEPYTDSKKHTVDDFRKLPKKKNLRKHIGKIYRRLRTIRRWKLSSYKETLSGDNDILIIEYRFAKLRELLGKIKSYNKKIRLLKRIVRKNDFKYLKYVVSGPYFRFPQYKNKNDKRGISVILNYSNSSYDLLLKSLDRISRQKLPKDFPWEVIIICNFIKDEVRAEIYRRWQRSNCPAALKIIEEKIIKPEAIRRAATAKSRFQYLLFLSEYDFIYPDYVRIAFKKIHNDKKAGIIGGQTELASNVKPPKWFENYKELFAVGKQAGESGDITFTRGYLWNSGIVARKKALQDIEIQNYNFSSIENNIEPNLIPYDFSFSNKIKLAGWKILYEERLKSERFVTVGQFNWEKLRKVYYSKGKEEIREESLKKLFKRGESDSAGKSWLSKANRTLRDLNKYPLKKILSEEYEYKNDVEVLEIERLRGRFTEIIKNKNKYDKFSDELGQRLNGKVVKDLQISKNGSVKSEKIKGVSIVICCYNSSEVLPATLKYIFTQNVPDEIPWEVIIVDNASTDNTAGVAQKIRNDYNCLCSFRIVKEPEPGLSAARLRGFNTAKYEYIIFCDDDNWLHRDFVKNVSDIMSSNMEIGVLGGQSKAEFDIIQPEWFDTWKNSYATGKQSDIEGDITHLRGYVWGAAMVVRKEAWKKLQAGGFKSLLTDRIGTAVSSGGDTEICYALRNDGWKIWYDSSLKFKHFISYKRLNWRYLRKLFRGFGQASPGLDYYLIKNKLKSNSKTRKINSKSAGKELHKTLAILRKTRYSKLLTFSKDRVGDTDIPMIEYCLGRVEGLLRTRVTYNRGIKLLKRAARKNDFKYLRSIFNNYDSKFPRYKTAKKLNGVSIIVCSYNGAERLGDTIRHLALQKVDKNILWEVIFVDNASTDNSKEVTFNEWNKHKCNAKLKIIDQPVPGKQLALEKGYEYAKHEFLITCDDDNWLDENFVQLTYEIMSSNEKVGILGGPNEPLCEIEPPEWFKYFKRDYAAGPQGDIHTGKISEGNITWKRGYVWGAGMIIRKSAWEKLKADGFKSSMSCRKGNELTSGGDSESCYALVLAGWHVWYDPRLKLKHCMPAGRLDWNYLTRLFVGFGVASVGLELYEKAIQLGKADVIDEEIKKKNWKYEFKKTIKDLRKYGLKKILSLRFSQNNNTDILMLEFNISRFKELLRLRKEYDKDFDDLINAPWKKKYSELKASHREYIESENDYRYGWPWSDEPPAELIEKTYPKISILSPSYNSKGTIEKAILSVLKQGYPNFEHIICDGGSKDGTVEIIKKYPHLKWVSEPDKGQSDAMNKAFEMSDGEIVAYLNADDYFQRGAFFKVSKEFEKDKTTEMVVGNLLFDFADHTFTRKPEIEYKKIMLPFLYMFPINPVCYFYKKSVQTEIGKFPVENHFTMDYWFLLKAYQNHKLVKIEDYLGTFCMNGYNKTSNADNRKNTHERVLYHCWNYDRKLLPFYLYNYFKFFYYDKKPYNLNKIAHKLRKNSVRIFSLFTLKKNKYYSQKLFELSRFRYYEKKRVHSVYNALASFLIYPKGLFQRSRQSQFLYSLLGPKYSEKTKAAYFFLTTPPGLPLANKLHYFGNEFKKNKKSLKGNSLLFLTYIISPKFIFKKGNRADSVISKANRSPFYYLNPLNWVRGFLNFFRYKKYREISYNLYINACEKYYFHKNIRSTVLMMLSFLIYPLSVTKRSRMNFFCYSALGNKLTEKLVFMKHLYKDNPEYSFAHKLNYYGNELRKEGTSVKGNFILIFAYILSPKHIFRRGKTGAAASVSKRLLLYYLNPLNWIKGLVNFFRFKKYREISHNYFNRAGEKNYFHKHFSATSLMVMSFLIYPYSLSKKSRLNLFVYSAFGNTLTEKLKFGYHLYKDNPEYTLAHKLNYYGNELRKENSGIKGNAILFSSYILSPKYFFKREKISKPNIVYVSNIIDVKRKTSFSTSGLSSNSLYGLRQIKYRSGNFGADIRNSKGKFNYAVKRAYHYFKYRKYKAKSKLLYADAIESYNNNQKFNAIKLLVPSYLLYPVSVFNRNKMSLMINSLFGNFLRRNTKKQK